MSEFTTSHSLPLCAAKEVDFQRFAAATVRDVAGFLADGVDSVDEEGTLASVQDVAPGCCCYCELATVTFVATAVLDFLVKNEARLDCRDFAAVEWSGSFRLRPC